MSFFHLRVPSWILMLQPEYCVSSKFICWNPSPQHDGIRRCALRGEIGSCGPSPHDGISALRRDHRESLVPSSPREDTARRQSMDQEVCPHQTWNRQVPSSWTSQLPELWQRNNCLLFKPPSPEPVVFFVIAARNDWETSQPSGMMSPWSVTFSQKFLVSRRPWQFWGILVSILYAAPQFVFEWFFFPGYTGVMGLGEPHPRVLYPPHPGTQAPVSCLGVNLVGKLLWHRMCTCLTSANDVRVFQGVISMYTPTNLIWKFLLLFNLTNTWYWTSF